MDSCFRRNDIEIEAGLMNQTPTFDIEIASSLRSLNDKAGNRFPLSRE